MVVLKIRNDECNSLCVRVGAVEINLICIIQIKHVYFVPPNKSWLFYFAT